MDSFRQPVRESREASSFHSRDYSQFWRSNLVVCDFRYSKLVVCVGKGEIFGVAESGYELLTQSRKDAKVETRVHMSVQQCQIFSFPSFLVN
jgi:hypothetical protein